MTGSEAVLAVNTGFYEAMERGDLEAMDALWLDGSAAEAASVSCVHAGWPTLRGRGGVLRSFALIMANTGYIQFFLTDVEVALSAEVAVVTCTENILSADDDASGPGPLVGGRVVATNVFRRREDGWRLWSRHASPVLAEDEDVEGDKPDDAGDITIADDPGGQN